MSSHSDVGSRQDAKGGSVRGGSRRPQVRPGCPAHVPRPAASAWPLAEADVPAIPLSPMSSRSPADDGRFMDLALAEADRAAVVGEVPVGAVVVLDGRVLA